MSEINLTGMMELFEKLDSANYRANTAMDWIEFDKANKSLGSFFDQNGMKRIGVYGYGKLGKLFINTLNEEGLDIEYIIDQKGPSLNAPYRAFSLDMNLPECDVVVVTTSGFNAIRETLFCKGIQNVISLRELLRCR